jgi:hypothetical protein
MKSTFDILFENIMSEISDAEQFGTDVFVSILKVYSWDPSKKGFTDVCKEITNFKFHEISGQENNDYLDELLIDKSSIDDMDLTDDAVKKILVFNKNDNKLLWEGIVASDKVDEVIKILNGPVVESMEDDYFDGITKVRHRDYTIVVYSWDDQGDIVYGFNLIKDGSEAGIYDSSEDAPNGYGTAEKAIELAKVKVDNLSGIATPVPKEPKCPYCGRKIHKTGLFYYNCINCGNIHKKYIEE